MQNMMAQAQKIQKDIMNKKNEINQMEFTEKNEFVEITVLGSKQIKQIKINPSLVTETEALEDMITLAYNNALKKVEKETEKALGAYGSLNGLI